MTVVPAQPEPGPTQPLATDHIDFSSQHVRQEHDWRVSQLKRVGVPVAMAESYADRVDWHQVARLVQAGCPPRLALRIVY